MTESLLGLYVCPLCRGMLRQEPGGLACGACGLAYPLIDGIPDFLPASTRGDVNPFLRLAGKIGKLAWVYERLWYPFFLNVIGGLHALTLGDLIAFARQEMLPVRGLVLDAAAGTGTYGRRVADRERTVYCVDLSMDMMRVGQAYARREGVTKIHFSRSPVEQLPFADSLFDGCFTCGSLHLFPDTLKALSEIGRTMKSSAPLVAFTLGRSDTGILKYPGIRRFLRRKALLTVFEPASLEKVLGEAGFEGFRPALKGAVLLFTARKR